jgi:hypothetical protein
MGLIVLLGGCAGGPVGKAGAFAADKGGAAALVIMRAAGVESPAQASATDRPPALSKSQPHWTEEWVWEGDAPNGP